MPQEFSDEEAKVLLGSKNLLDKLLKSPKTRRQAEKLVKELYPETVTTDDMAAPYTEKLDALEKKLDDYFKKTEGDKLDAKLDEDTRYLMEKRGFSEEGIEKLKKLMVQKTIPDIIVAADHWEKQNPPKQQEPSTFQPTDWGFGREGDDADMKLLYKDPDAWAEKEANRAWNEEVAKKGQIIT